VPCQSELLRFDVSHRILMLQQETFDVSATSLLDLCDAEAFCLASFDQMLRLIPEIRFLVVEARRADDFLNAIIQPVV
jgi:hypothetical protein